MKKLLKVVKKCKKKTDRGMVFISLFTDGSGSVNVYESVLFNFKNLKELKNWLKN